MSGPPPREAEERRRRARRAVTAAIAVLAASLIFLLLMFVPLWTTAHRLSVPSSGYTLSFSIASPTEVTVHLEERDALSVNYWIRGPGIMAGNASGVVDPSGSSIAFWTWGGAYQVGFLGGTYTCGLPCYFPSTTTVWVNVTTGVV